MMVSCFTPPSFFKQVSPLSLPHYFLSLKPLTPLRFDGQQTCFAVIHSIQFSGKISTYRKMLCSVSFISHFSPSLSSFSPNFSDISPWIWQNFTGFLGNFGMTLDLYGVSMGFLWDFYGISMGFMTSTLHLAPGFFALAQAVTESVVATSSMLRFNVSSLEDATNGMRIFHEKQSILRGTLW